MTKKLSRRDFFKIATGALAATGFSPLVRRVVLEPFVHPPEEMLVGSDTWYASTCRQCPAGCGIVVRVVNGRAKKIEGNPLHPLNRGKLCARGQSGLQELYNPDRLKNAVSQSGGRGSRQFAPLYWDAALDILSGKITQLSDPSRLAFLGGLMSSHLYWLVNHLLEALKSPPPIIFDMHSALEGRLTATQMAQTFFGTPTLPIYDLARSEVIFSFGANFLETWMSPVSQSYDYGLLRQGRYGGRGFMVHFEPRLSATAACADEWVPLQPGTEGFVALAIGRIIVEEKLGRVSSHSQHAVLYQNIDIRAMSEASQVSLERLYRLARIFAEADQAVAIPGGYLAGQQNGLSAMQAVQALNLVTGQLGREGGVYLSTEAPSTKLFQGPQVDPYDQLMNLIARMKAGDVDLLVIHGANPMFELPASVGFAEAIKQVPFVVSFNQFVDETSVWSDLILPEHSYLESWGMHIPSPGTLRPTISNQQPVVQTLYDTRSTADVLLAVTRKLGGKANEALHWADEVAFLQDIASELHASSLSPYESATPAGFWSRWRQYGGWWSEKEIPREPELTEVTQVPLLPKAPHFEGDPAVYPFHFYPFSSLSLSDGRGANIPWLQEMPDPMTTVSWGTWVELNPETARALDVSDNDIVKVISPYGEIEAPVVIFPGLRPDVVAIPVGQGHSDYGRFAEKRGSNPLLLLAPSMDPDSGALAWGVTRVRLEKTGRKKQLARLESLDGAGRETLS